MGVRVESEPEVGVEREGAVKEADGVAGSDKIISPAVESETDKEFKCGAHMQMDNFLLR